MSGADDTAPLRDVLERLLAAELDACRLALEVVVEAAAVGDQLAAAILRKHQEGPS